MSAQILGATLASATLRLIFSGLENHFAGTVLTGSYLQSYVVEYIITFFVMFVVSSVATDKRAVSSSSPNKYWSNFLKHHI